MLVEDLDRQCRRDWLRLQHQRRDGGDQTRLGDPLRAVAADITSDFTAARGEAEQHSILEVERLDERREIVGIGVHLVAVPGLAGAAMAATIVGDTR